VGRCGYCNTVVAGVCYIVLVVDTGSLFDEFAAVLLGDWPFDSAGRVVSDEASDEGLGLCGGDGAGGAAG